VEIIFIRHGHGEHLNDYPHCLNTVHPGLTACGEQQVIELSKKLEINDEDLVIVSPTKRTIETAKILKGNTKFIISPLVGPRMFPQCKELPVFTCDQIYLKSELSSTYSGFDIVDFNFNCWETGINTINERQFEDYAKQLINWIKTKNRKIYIISHDGTITHYRLLLGEKNLTRHNFLGEAGHYCMSVY